MNDDLKKGSGDQSIKPLKKGGHIPSANEQRMGMAIDAYN
jgi:hypothetical protein